MFTTIVARRAPVVATALAATIAVTAGCSSSGSPASLHSTGSSTTPTNSSQSSPADPNQLSASKPWHLPDCFPGAGLRDWTKPLKVLQSNDYANGQVIYVPALATFAEWDSMNQALVHAGFYSKDGTFVTAGSWIVGGTSANYTYVLKGKTPGDPACMAIVRNKVSVNISGDQAIAEVDLTY